MERCRRRCARIGEGGKSLRWSAIKVWLTGEVSQHFDLEVRAFNSNLSWTGGYVSGHDLDFTSVNGFGDLRGVNELRCVQVDLIPKPNGATVLREFSKGSRRLSLTDQELDSLSGRYLSCVVQQVFPTELRSGIDFDSPLVSRFHGSVSAGPVHVGGIKVVYHADGIDDESVVFTETAQAGPHTASDDATSAAIKTHCNLNDHFDEDPSTGFTGWFTDKGLTSPYGGSELSAGDELHLYSRNRLTLRCAFTDNSVDTTELVLRLRPNRPPRLPNHGLCRISGCLTKGMPLTASAFPLSAMTGPPTRRFISVSRSRSQGPWAGCTPAWRTEPGRAFAP